MGYIAPVHLNKYSQYHRRDTTYESKTNLALQKVYRTTLRGTTNGIHYNQKENMNHFKQMRIREINKLTSDVTGKGRFIDETV